MADSAIEVAYYSTSRAGLPFFAVDGGPFAHPQTMGVHITDDGGHTLAVSCDTGFADRAVAGEIVADFFRRFRLLDYIEERCDSGYLALLAPEREALRKAVAVLTQDGTQPGGTYAMRRIS